MPLNSWNARCDLNPSKTFIDLDYDFAILINFLLFFSNRPTVTECLNHKFLTTDLAVINTSEAISLPIFNVQNLNVTITAIPFDNDISSDSDSYLNSDEDKENSVKALDNGDKETAAITSIVQQHIAVTNTKLRLEKSSSISLFPDAPTTPKVCRKAPCDENTNSFLIPVPST